MYNRSLEKTEDLVWGASPEKSTVGGQNLVGLPLRIVFHETLSRNTFKNLVSALFIHGKSKFRLWGSPIVMAPTKVHVYGLDQHLWQPLYIEITEKHILVIIPRGTCGNTVHRLITNVQHFLDPEAKAYIGEQGYAELMVESLSLENS
jgi:hypothetical protein